VREKSDAGEGLLVRTAQTRLKQRILLGFLFEKGPGAALPLTGCSKVIYLRDLVLGCSGDAHATH